MTRRGLVLLGSLEIALFLLSFGIEAILRETFPSWLAWLPGPDGAVLRVGVIAAVLASLVVLGAALWRFARGLVRPGDCQ